ncbi:MAG TPA: VOC family protein [Terriglobia bacterium]|nr:VOC family protein [Terriglobia bacterium]
MKKLILALCAILLLSAGPTWAQAFQPNEAGVTMGHWHLNSRDIEANKKIFVAMGGTEVKGGNFQVVRFPGVLVYLHLAPGAQPPAGGTVGSVVNHVGFTVQNVQQSVARWKAAGVPVLPGGNGRTDQAFVVTPDELRIEILEDKSQKFPIQHHHIHMFVPETAIPQIQAWYAKTFGAKAGTRGQNQAADLPGANLTFGKADGATVTTKGRVLDHIGFDVKNLEAFCKKLEAAGIKLDRPYTKNPQTGGGLAFIYDPWGTYIELNERPDAVYIQTTSRE